MPAVRGIVPDAVVGHSMGEVAAALGAGKLTLAKACRVLRARNAAVAAACGSGGMATVEADPSDVTAILSELGSPVVVAARNSPRMAVLSGPTQALDDALGALRRRGVEVRIVKVNYPSHSPLMLEPATQLRRALAGLTPSPAGRRFYSTVTGADATDRPLDAGYWASNLASPVLFDRAITAMLEDGITHLVELNAHPVLLPAVQECIADSGHQAVVLPTLNRREPRVHGVHDVLAALYKHGFDPQWPAHPSARQHAHELPTYPFARTIVRGVGFNDGAESDTTAAIRAGLSMVEASWQPGTFVGEPHLAAHHREHRIGGRPILSIASIAALLLAATPRATPQPARLTGLTIHQPIPASAGVRLQLVAQHATDGTGHVRIAVHDGDMWSDAVTVDLAVTDDAEADSGDQPTSPDTTAWQTDRLRTWLSAAGVDLGSALTWLTNLTVGAGCATAMLETPRGVAVSPDAGTAPSMLDAALTVLAAATAHDADDATSGAWIIGDVRTIWIHPDLWTCTRAVVSARLHDGSGNLSRHGTLLIHDRAGRRLAQLQGVRLHHVTPALTTTVETQTPVGSRHELADRVLSCPTPDEQRRVLTMELWQLLTAIVPGLGDSAQHLDVPFQDLGLDSLMGVELRNRLEQRLGVRLTVALVWAYPTVGQLAGALLAKLTPASAPDRPGRIDVPAQRAVPARPRVAATQHPDGLQQLTDLLDDIDVVLEGKVA